MRSTVRGIAALLLTLASMLPCALSARAASAPKDMHIEADGLWLRLRERVDPAAAAPPATAVLFVHGAVFPGVPTFDRDAADSWLAAALAAGLDPYLLDLDGYGESMPPRGRDVCSLPRAVADVAAAVAALARSHPGGVDVVGYDYGADVAAAYAAGTPVTKLVLVAPLLAPDALEDQTVLTAPLLRAWLGSRVPAAVAERAVTMALLGTRDAGLRTPPALVVPAGVFASLVSPPISPAMLDSISAPTLLVRGRSDAVFDEADARELLGGAPRVRLLLVDGDHRLPWEAGGVEAAREIATFLSTTGTPVH
ncbi:MAG TPA: alpha/beta fold hydrolase [Candidatus Dormibacteraeota bacterium]|nr:alpha/beta fold hydrolase [Candidatus Dormibacteraeota bacterium]